jgi:hypothetical protein
VASFLMAEATSGRVSVLRGEAQDNVRVIERLGGVLGVELTDDDLSAWRPSVRRPDWERLLERFAGAVCWSGLLERFAGAVCWSGLLERFAGAAAGVLRPGVDVGLRPR